MAYDGLIWYRDEFKQRNRYFSKMVGKWLESRMVEMILKIELKNHLKALGFLFTTSLILLVGGILLQINLESILFGFALYSIFLLPSLYLYLEYYLRNQGQRLEIRSDEIVFFKKNVEVKRFAFEDLKKIELYKSASLEKGGIQLTPLESYHYAKIISKKMKLL